MLKQSIAYLILSILIIIFAQYTHLLVIYIVMFYTFITLKLTPLFNGLDNGVMIRNIFSLALLPVIIAGIPALLYRAIKGKHMPGFFEITWILWLIIVLSKVLIR